MVVLKHSEWVSEVREWYEICPYIPTDCTVLFGRSLYRLGWKSLNSSRISVQMEVVCVCVCAKLLQSCLTLCSPVGSPGGGYRWLLIGRKAKPHPQCTGTCSLID